MTEPTPWTPDQPLRADADHQKIAERANFLYWQAPPSRDRGNSWSKAVMEYYTATPIAVPPSPSVRDAVREPSRDAISEHELGGWMEKVRDAIFYARVHARSKGYALAVHGTLRRDVDVVAVPWTDEACDPDELVESIADNFIALGLSYEGGKTHMKQSREVKPFGRLAYALPLKGIPAPYLDLSVAPRIVYPPVSAAPSEENR
ncbi:MAG TPA: hypothetical protein VGI97_14855 [Gemmatimonadaceae bacterium]|jgi:hypothetical protein